MVKLKLIDGEFSAIEFKEILLNLFLKKIEFHKVKNYSSQVRFGIDDPVAIQKISELKQSIETITQLFEIAQKKDFRIAVFSEVDIEFVSSNCLSHTADLLVDKEQ